jgi:hypothetical protein
MILAPATPDDIRHVALRMREQDFAEAEPTCWSCDRAGVAEELVLRLDGQPGVFAVGPRRGAAPVCIAGAIPVRPNSLGLILFATDEWSRVGGRLSYFMKRRYIPAAIQDGVHRMEAITLDRHAVSHRWLRYLGLSQEAQLPAYGKRGETFLLFAWVC